MAAFSRGNKTAVAIRAAAVMAALALASVRGSFGDPLRAEDGLWGENLLPNPSFEAGEGEPAHWVKTIGAQMNRIGAASTVESDVRDAADGKRSLRLSVKDEDATFFALASPAVKVTAGSRYRLAGTMRTLDVRRVGQQYTNCNFFVSFRNQSGQPINIRGFPALGTEPLTGTRDWQPVERILRAPPGAVSATVGCFLSVSGTAWFDQVSLSEQRPIAWKLKESARFRCFYEGAETSSIDAIATALQGNDQNLERLEKTLGVTHPEKIGYYKYASNQRKGAVTGDGGNAHVDGSEIHSIFWSDRHEIVHILMNQLLASPIPLLGEGIAVHCSENWQGKPVHQAARALLMEKKLLPLPGLLDAGQFRSRPDEVTYPQAGSFVGFLVESRGIDSFKKIYTSCPMGLEIPELLRRFEKVYGKSLALLEAEWIQYLSK